MPKRKLSSSPQTDKSPKKTSKTDWDSSSNEGDDTSNLDERIQQLRNRSSMLYMLEERFRDPEKSEEQRIEIKFIGNRPTSAWIIKTDKEDAEFYAEEEHRIILEKMLPLPQEFIDKWKKDDVRINRMLETFYTASKNMILNVVEDADGKEKKYFFDEVEKEKRKSYKDSLEKKSKKATQRQDSPETSRKHGKDSPETSRKHGKESPETSGKRGKVVSHANKGRYQGNLECKTVMEEDLSDYLYQDFLIAISSHMHNSKGRSFVNSLFKAVAYSCFGVKYARRVGLRIVGSSNSETEGFPVSSRNKSGPQVQLQNVQGAIDAAAPGDGAKDVDKWASSTVTANADTEFSTPCRPLAGRSSRSRGSSRSPRKRGAARNPCTIQSPGSCVETTSHSSVQSTSQSQSLSSPRKGKFQRGGFIYPDFYVASYQDPKYLIVVEIKGNNQLQQKDVVQLYREMIGAGMHQTEVFGVLINATEAKIYRMILDKDKKEINVSYPDTYYFFSTRADKFMFDMESCKSFFAFFRTLVSVTDYAENNISVNSI